MHRCRYGAPAFAGNLLGGIANIEGAYYDSRDDRDGTDPLIRNSEIRGLAGYERELVANFMLGLQYYLEWLQNYDAPHRQFVVAERRAERNAADANRTPDVAAHAADVDAVFVRVLRLRRR